jgi:ribosomal protein L37AE/L43A
MTYYCPNCDKQLMKMPDKSWACNHCEIYYVGAGIKYAPTFIIGDERRAASWHATFGDSKERKD